MGITPPGNIEKLQAGEPMLIKAEQIGIPIDVVLQYNVNNDALLKDFEKLGVKIDNAEKVIDNRCSDPNCKDCGNV